MSKETKRQDLANVWGPRVQAAQKYYDNWSRKFHVDDLEKAYYGFQWDENESDPEEYMPYVLNLIFSSIDVKLPTLLFTNPVYNISPKPAKYDFNPADATFRSRLKEDTLNYFAQGGIKHFGEEIEMCILDAFFRFGVLEIGYSADFVHNPDAGKPFLASDQSTMVDKNGKVIEQPDVLIEEERIYAKRIPAKRFRVGGVDQSNLARCSWYGYYDFIRKEDLLAASKTNKGYNSEVIERADGISPDSSNWDTDALSFIRDAIRDAGDDSHDLILIWKIYDMRANKLIMFNHDISDILYTEDIKRPQHFVLKFRPLLEGFYPLPVTFNWISAQSEVNETREAMRIHRRRFQRKYLAMKGKIDDEEMDKLINGGDGTWAFTNGAPGESVVALPSPNLGSQQDQALVISKDDFNTISGTSAEQRGQSDRTTATQSQIKEKRSVIRESRDKEIVANWLREIGKEVLLVSKENLTLPFWVKVTQDSPGLFAESEFTESKFNLINTDDFGDEDFEVNIKVSSLSPVDQVEEKNKLVEFLSLITQFPQVSMSPLLVQEVADRTGFRNERAIAEVVKMSQLMQTLQVVQLSQQTGQDPSQLFIESFMRNNGAGDQNPVAQRTTAQLTPPDQEQIQNQIGNQLTQPAE